MDGNGNHWPGETLCSWLCELVHVLTKSMWLGYFCGLVFVCFVSVWLPLKPHLFRSHRSKTYQQMDECLSWHLLFLSISSPTVVENKDGQEGMKTNKVRMTEKKIKIETELVTESLVHTASSMLDPFRVGVGRQLLPVLFITFMGRISRSGWMESCLVSSGFNGCMDGWLDKWWSLWCCCVNILIDL